MLESDPLLEMVLARLERVSVDSPLAHRASGIRGAILRILEEQQGGIITEDRKLGVHLNAALEILRRAAAALANRELSQS